MRTPTPWPQGFAITSNRGFQVRFPNGTMVSVQFGPSCYCQNYDARWDISPVRSPDAEIAVLDAEGNFITARVVPWAEREVVGYQSVKQALEILNLAAAWDDGARNDDKK